MPRLLEKKSISITRLKRFWLDDHPRRGNLPWKEKYLDYEIETMGGGGGSSPSYPWKEKYLDYEIETLYPISQTLKLTVLEKKSISITRLKPEVEQPPCVVRSSWKEKYLDYEIETHVTWKTRHNFSSLEKKSISITRLKLPPLYRLDMPYFALKRKVSRLRDWNSANIVLS